MKMRWKYASSKRASASGMLLHVCVCVWARTAWLRQQLYSPLLHYCLLLLFLLFLLFFRNVFNVFIVWIFIFATHVTVYRLFAWLTIVLVLVVDFTQYFINAFWPCFIFICLHISFTLNSYFCFMQGFYKSTDFAFVCEFLFGLFFFLHLHTLACIKNQQQQL